MQQALGMARRATFFSHCLCTSCCRLPLQSCSAIDRCSTDIPMKVVTDCCLNLPPNRLCCSLVSTVC